MEKRPVGCGSREKKKRAKNLTDKTKRKGETLGGDKAKEMDESIQNWWPEGNEDRAIKRWGEKRVKGKKGWKRERTAQKDNPKWQK